MSDLKSASLIVSKHLDLNLLTDAANRHTFADRQLTLLPTLWQIVLSEFFGL